MGKKEKKEKASKPKQKDLPGMEERKIPDLHAAAEDYAEIRDERMALTEKEVPAKANLLELMHKHGKETYKYEDVEISVVHEEETVKVKIHREKEAAD